MPSVKTTLEQPGTGSVTDEIMLDVHSQLQVYAASGEVTTAGSSVSLEEHPQSSGKYILRFK